MVYTQHNLFVNFIIVDAQLEGNRYTRQKDVYFLLYQVFEGS